MDIINFNKYSNRLEIYDEIKNILINFESNSNNKLLKKNIYLYGSPGSGKTFFINNLIKELNYNSIIYNSCEIRNKSINKLINDHTISNTSIINLFNKKNKKMVIIIDDVDSMCNNDKNNMNELIKLIRPKKTKKQKEEYYINIPIICIGNINNDKKIKELIKVSNNFELKNFNKSDYINIIKNLFINIDDEYLINKLYEYFDNNLNKMFLIYKLYKKNNYIIDNKYLINLLDIKYDYNENIKSVCKNLIINKYNIKDHNLIINETDRTTIGYLWHENIINILHEKNINSVSLYLNFLKNICYADYIDRITFQKQIWQFNEISSLIKIFYNNYLLHNQENLINKNSKFNIEFTKILTKYSTQYNNSLFIQNLCSNLNIDKKDMLSFFIKNDKCNIIDKLYLKLDYYNINKLDIDRIYRYIYKLYYDEY